MNKGDNCNCQVKVVVRNHGKTVKHKAICPECGDKYVTILERVPSKESRASTDIFYTDTFCQCKKCGCKFDVKQEVGRRHHKIRGVLSVLLMAVGVILCGIAVCAFVGVFREYNDPAATVLEIRDYMIFGLGCLLGSFAVLSAVDFNDL